MAEGSPVGLGRGGWLKRYPPLVLLVVAVLITAMYLPSALNLPQSNPSTVLEYAPVPPEDQDTPPSTEGSISALGLGSSGSLTTSSTTPPPGDVQQEAEAERPTVKRCVGDPPRQTEDPNSPPCVAFFDGDNGGATWQGVTGDEITVLVYQSTHYLIGGDEGAEETPPAGTYCDVDSAPNSDPNCLEQSRQLRDHYVVRVFRTMSRYFNDRFQIYNRRVHFWIYWTSSGSEGSPAGRRAAAADNWERLKPFAAIDRANFGGYNDVYAESMVKRRTMVFGALAPRPAEYYRKYAPMIWNFWFDTEHWADLHTSYICQKVAPYPVSHSGNSSDNGKPRKYALLSANDPSYSNLTHFSQLVEQGIRQCIPEEDIVAEATFPRHQFAVDTHPDASSAARQNIAKFQAAGATTILWNGGYEVEHSKAAHDAGWHPEWVVAGDGWHDYLQNSRFQQQDAWRHAWIATGQIRADREEDAPCRMAYRDAEPSGNDGDESLTCEVYRDLFMLFSGIQAAGPYLMPDSVNQGMHSIPRKASENPYTAACFFDPGDYTCVKDMQEAWWDPDAEDPEGDPDEEGCWRQVRGGQRYLARQWGGGDDVFANPNDPCNIHDAVSSINPYGPQG